MLKQFLVIYMDIHVLTNSSRVNNKQKNTNKTKQNSHKIRKHTNSCQN